MEDIEKKFLSWKNHLTEYETEEDARYLKGIFNTTEDHDEMFKEFDDTFTLKEKEKILVICDFFIEIERNLLNLSNGLYDLMIQKKYKLSMYLLRGLIENALFAIYISHKLFNHLNKVDFKNFFNIFWKANYGHREISFKSYELVTSNDIYFKAAKKIRAEKIHINNCLEFYNNTNFKIRFMEIKKMTHFLDKKNYKDTFRTSFFKFIEREITGKENVKLQTLYNQLCEIIHPTSIILHSHDDKASNLYYRTLFRNLIATEVLPNAMACLLLNINVVEVIKKNKVLFVEQFDEFLDSKTNRIH